VSAQGLAVSVSACPYAFTTQGVASVTWPSDEPHWGTTVAQGFLDAKHAFGLSWTERINPIDGELDVSGISVVLHDAVAASGDAAGYNLISYLGTRLETEIASTRLEASADADALTLTVANAALFDPFPRVVWIGTEAVYCDSRTGATTLNVNAAGRGWYGSKAVPHTVNSAYSVYPEVWGSFPWFARRRVVLWRVNTVSTAVEPLWRGYCQKAPRLTKQGGPMELQLQSSAARHRELRLGVPDAVCRLRGFDRGAAVLGVKTEATGFEIDSRMREGGRSVQSTLGDVLSGANAVLQERLGDAGVTVATAPVITDTGVRFTASAPSSSTLHVTMQLGTQYANSRDATTTTPRVTSVEIEGVPSALVGLGNGDSEVSVPIDRVDGLPTAWPQQSYTDGSYRTYVDGMLRGEYSDDEWVDVVPSSTSPVSADDAEFGGPSFTGFGAFTPRKPYGAIRRGGLAERAVPMKMVTHVEAGHWCYGVKRIVEDTTYVRSGADSRDFSWSSLNRVAGVTAGRWASRVWDLDGSQKLGDFIRDAALPHGCALGIRNSKMALVAFAPPGPATTAKATITGANLVPGTVPHWEYLDDGIMNSLRLQGTSLDLTINDARSIGRYGHAGTIPLKLNGLQLERTLTDNPMTLASELLSRVLQLWSKPRRVLRVTVPWSQYFSVWHGDFVRVDAFSAPTGEGGRGISNAWGLVFGRDVSLRGNELHLEMLVLETAVGYGPCIRVASVSGSTLTAADSYVGGDSDYAGSFEGDYTGTAEDLGVSMFTAGDAVELININDNVGTREAATVQSVNPGAGTITLTGAPGAGWAVDAPLGKVNLRFAPYATTQTSQRTYAFVGDATTNTIDGTSDPAQEFAP
jgi:hypothetical protein